MKRFNFKSQLKGLGLTELEKLKEYHLDLMLSFLGCDSQKNASTHNRYISYIDDVINKLNNKNQ